MTQNQIRSNNAKTTQIYALTTQNNQSGKTKDRSHFQTVLSTLSCNSQSPRYLEAYSSIAFDSTPSSVAGRRLHRKTPSLFSSWSDDKTLAKPLTTVLGSDSPRSTERTYNVSEVGCYAETTKRNIRTDIHKLKT